MLDPARIICGGEWDNVQTVLAHASVGPGEEGVFARNGILAYRIASAGHNGGLSLLLALPGERDRKTLQEAIDKAGSSVGELVEVGSHAERFHVKS